MSYGARCERVPLEATLNVRLDEATFRRLAELADLEGMSLGGLVRSLVKRHLRSTEAPAKSAAA